MRGEKYDVVILAYAKQPRLCLASALSGAKRRIAMWSGVWGRLTGHECLPSHILDNPRPVSEILLSCSRALGATDQGLKPDLFFSANEVESTRELIPKSLRERRLIGIHPGSAGSACNLPSHVYAAIAAQILRETDYGIVLTGTTDELKLLTDWPAKILSSERVWNALGQISLRELGCIVAEMTVYVCSSTGPLHVASAVGTRTVSPFCPVLPMNAAIWGNVGAKSRVVEPEACPRLSGSKSPCDFRDTISASDIFAAVIDIASSAKPL